MKLLVKLSKVTLLALLLASMTACKWRDDFRERRQPEIIKPVAKPTLNPDSPEYVGYNSKEVDEAICADIPLPDIDRLSTIPEVPDHPAGAQYN